jgi:hypothetical protein
MPSGSRKERSWLPGLPEPSTARRGDRRGRREETARNQREGPGEPESFINSPNQKLSTAPDGCVAAASRVCPAEGAPTPHSRRGGKAR